MKMLTACVMLAIAMLPGAAGAQELRPEDQALRSRLAAHYDIVPLSNAIGLRPKTSGTDIRLIEVSDAIAVNGVVVTGRELRDRVGGDADDILRLSYLEPAVRKALFASPPPESGQPEAPEPPATPEPPAAPEPPRRDDDAASSRAMRRSNGDRVRIFGDVTVRQGEEVTGQAVAVFGSVHVDGQVGDQVVAVLGSVDLGDNAVVRGDVVSVGGRVRQAPGARIGGGVTEISLADAGTRARIAPFMGGLGALSLFDGFSAFPRLIGTTFRLLLLLLFASLALVVARSSVERSAQRVSDNPVKATLVGLAAEILFIPLFVLTCIVLAITIVGIPLLILMPFVVLFVILLALVGFTGAAMAIGQWARRRFGIAPASEFADVWLGILIVLLPVLLGRLVGLGGFLTGPVAILLIAAGFGLEFLVWSTGFGAVITNAFSRWQARRTVHPVMPPPATP
jgi:hypothetical protein